MEGPQAVHAVHGWVPPENFDVQSCDDYIDKAMAGSVDNPTIGFDLNGALGGFETTTTSKPTTTQAPIHPQCLNYGQMTNQLVGSSMCNGVDFMGIHQVATEACMAEMLDGEETSPKIRCQNGLGYIYEYQNGDCSGDATVTLAADMDITVNCDGFLGDCEYVIIRHGVAGADAPDSKLKSGSGSKSSSEDAPDSKSSESASGSKSGSAEAPESKSGSADEAPESKEGTEDAPDSKSGTEDAPDGKSGSEDGGRRLLQDAPDSKSGTEDAPESKSGSQDGDAPESKEGTEEAPDGKSGSEDAPESKSGSESGSGSKSGSESGSG